MKTQKITRDLKTRYSEDDDKILKKFAGTKRPLVIAQILGRTRQSVLGRAKKLGLRMMPNGENHHASKHSSTMVEWVRQMHDDGIPTSLISKYTKIKYRTIRHWVEYRGRNNE